LQEAERRASGPRSTGERFLPARADAFATIHGQARTSRNATLPNTLMRLRDARLGQPVATQVTDEMGVFAFPRVDPGSYVVELLGTTGRPLATSQVLSLNAGETANVVVKLPLGSSRLSALLWQGTPSADLPAGTDLVPTIIALLPQAVLHAIPIEVPIGDPVSER
jgi:hypothetical protein